MNLVAMPCRRAVSVVWIQDHMCHSFKSAVSRCTGIRDIRLQGVCIEISGEGHVHKPGGITLE